MPGFISIDLNLNVEDLLGKTWNRFLSMFGRDAETLKIKQWLEERTKIAFLSSRDVQCIGMHSPILLSEIYQPTRLLRDRPQTIRDQGSNRQWEAQEPENITVETFLTQRNNTIITAGPGWGKTTFLRAVFIHFLLSANDTVFPILFALRDSEAISDLKNFVSTLGRVKALNANRRILLLVDGYDEIPTESRKTVSEILQRFAARGVGEYFLTCRDHYQILDLTAPRLRISDFTHVDQIGFVTAFLRVSGGAGRAEEIVNGLTSRGFSDLLRHPLLLTLECIVRSSNTASAQPSNVVSLIQSAINTLSWRWDEGKGLNRERATPLDGNARVKCLRRIAYALGSDLEAVAQQRVVNITKKQLELMRWDEVDPLQVLTEIARFYGIFVPMGDKWGFVHRSLQDFLAAQVWVETGQFADELKQGILRFDSRTAFAGCLMDDATQVMELALQHKEGLPIFAEMLINDPSFNHTRIARAVQSYYGEYKGEHYYRREDDKLECHLQDEFVSGASSKFLDCLVQVCGATRSKTTDTLSAYAIIELVRRHVPLSEAAYSACKRNFRSDKFAFQVPNKPHLRMIDVSHIQPHKKLSADR